MKRFSAALFVLLLVSFAQAQQTWERTYGGPSDDWGESVQQTSEGGYIVAGYTHSFGAGGNDVYLIKTNASGDTLWTRTYGGTGDDQGYSVRQTPDGGYIVAGWTNSFGAGGYDVYLIKTNASGDTLWTRTYGGPSPDYGRSVQPTSDGGYIITGTTVSFGPGIYNVYLIKTDASGNTVWASAYGKGYDEEGFSVQQTSDGGYIVAGRSNTSGPYYGAYLVKTNASGDTLWTRTYAHGFSSDDEGTSVQQTSEGGYIIAGFSGPPAGPYDAYLIKTNSSGDTLWTKTYGGTNDDRGWSARQTTDFGYIIAGWTASFGSGHDDVYLIKTNASGDTLWTRTFGGPAYEYGYSVQQTSDGGYIVAGANSDVYLIKTDVNGNVGVEEPGRSTFNVQRSTYKITPNPFTSFARVPSHEEERFSLYDVSGRMMGTYKGDRIGEGLAAGVYFLRPLEEGGKPVRVVKVR